MSKEINFKNLIYNFKTRGIPLLNFIELKDPMHIYNQLKNGHMTLSQVEEDQKKFKTKLNRIALENPDHKSENQLNTIKNVKNLHNSRQKIIDLLNNYSRIKLESIYKAKQNEIKGAGFKILTPKQMLQRLPVALAQVKAGNNSEGLLNEIR